MDRRAFLALSTAGAMATTLKSATAATEGPFGETGVLVPSSPTAKLPLGPLPNTRYPDSHIESLDNCLVKSNDIVQAQHFCESWRELLSRYKNMRP